MLDKNISKSYRCNSDIFVRKFDVKDMTYDDRVYAWHSFDKTVNFGKYYIWIQIRNYRFLWLQSNARTDKVCIKHIKIK